MQQKGTDVVLPVAGKRNHDDQGSVHKACSNGKIGKVCCRPTDVLNSHLQQRCKSACGTNHASSKNDQFSRCRGPLRWGRACPYTILCSFWHFTMLHPSVWEHRGKAIVQ